MSADDASTTSEPPAQCLACRGTGTVISGLGGTPHEVRCPWCEGTGHRIPGIDAQANPSENGVAAGGEAAKATEADAPAEATPGQTGP